MHIDKFSKNIRKDIVQKRRIEYLLHGPFIKIGSGPLGSSADVARIST
jgi:hypothetical protein